MRSPSSSSRCLCGRADRPVRPRPEELHDRRAEAGRAAVLRQARCVECHPVSGQSNEMFSDFREHVDRRSADRACRRQRDFDGPGENEDFGWSRSPGTPKDRYKFRTSPIRNVALQPAFIHNGAFTSAGGRGPAPSGRVYVNARLQPARCWSCWRSLGRAGPYRASARESRSRSGHSGSFDRR